MQGMAGSLTTKILSVKIGKTSIKYLPLKNFRLYIILLYIYGICRSFMEYFFLLIIGDEETC